MTAKPIDTVFRDFVTEGVPASGTNKPKKAEIRDTLNQFFVYLTGANAGAIIKTSLAALNAFLTPEDNTMAWVVGDPDPDNDGVYERTVSDGGWTRRAPLPYPVIHLNNAGAGTADAIVVTTAVGVPSAAYKALYVLNIIAANTGPVTVAINGGDAKPLVTNTGDALEAGYLTAGMAVLCVDDGTNLRMLSYGDVVSEVEALVDRAETAAADAQSAAASVEVVAQRDPRYWGAIGDGNSHPLSDYFPTLDAAQAVYPHADALDCERDWAAIQGAINAGKPLFFSGGSYRFNRQISITTDNVRIDGDRTALIVPDMDYFTNNTRAGELGATGCIILATGSYTSPYTPIDKLLIRGLRFDGGSVDDRRTTIIAVKNAKNPVVEFNEAENFAVGYFVYGEAITGDQARIWLNYAHDWYSDASYGGDNQTSQTTVVGIDDGALPDNSRSDGIDIGWNCGARLVKGPTLLAALGQQTDVVNILNRVSKNHKIHHNEGREIDELVDCFGTDCDIYENRGWDITASIVKLAHGANGNHVHHNRGWNVSRWPIVLNAAPTDVDNIENNHVHDNYIYGIVDSADARGCVTLLDGGTGAAPYVQNNYFSNNYLDPGAGGQSCIHASISGGNGNFFSNDIFVQEGTLGWVSGGTEGVKRARIQKPQRATHFRCRLGSAQNLTALSTKLDFSDVADDMRSEWDATNKRWVCQIPGRYRIGVDLRANAWPVSTVFSIRIKVNGAEVAQKDFNFANASSQGLDFNREFQLYSGDYVEVYMMFDSTPNVVLTQGGAYSLLTIDML